MLGLTNSPKIRAQENSPAPADLRLTLQECIRLALEHNLEILHERINPRKDATKIIFEEAVFDPGFTLGVSKDVNENRGPSSLSGARVSRQENILANMGVKQKTASGATLELDFNNREFRSNSTFLTVNPYYESSLVLKFSQPLLQGRGEEVNQALITIAVNNREVSLFKLKQKLIETVSAVQKTYWEIVYNQNFLEVKKLLLKQAQDLLEINKTKVFIGILPQYGIEILEAESSIASREADVIAAQDSLKDVSDKLKKIINRLEDEEDVTPVDNPTTQEVLTTFDDNIHLAYKSRPDYLGLRKELETEKVNVNLAQNQRLHKLDLVGQWGVNGLDSSYGGNLERLADLNYRTWMVGLNLEIPWGNRQDESLYMERRLILEQKELEIKNLAQQISLEIKESVRQIKTNRRRILAGQIAYSLEGKKLATAEEKYRLGEINFTTHDVLEYQTQLAQARINLLRAIIDYNNSLVDLGVRSGTLLEDSQIRLKGAES